MTVPADFIPAGNEPRRQALPLVGRKDRLPKFAAAVKASPPPEDLAELAKPGRPRWTAEIVTQGKLSRDDESPYVVDTLTLPFDNPYKALMFVGGHDFFANGDIAICTVHGDVWRVSGVNDEARPPRLETLRDRPLPAAGAQDRATTTCTCWAATRSRGWSITTHDGEADEYQCFTNAYPTSAGGHDYVTCLETDSQGRISLRARDAKGCVRVAKRRQTRRAPWPPAFAIPTACRSVRATS